MAVETEESQICITGVEYGRRYHIRLRAGLPSAGGETLRNDVALDVYVPDRAPFVGFANNSYVMPAGLGGGLPITSVNAKTADVVIYRIGDRSIATAVRNGIFQRTLDALGLGWSQAAAIGDDWPDLPVMRRCAFAGAPLNAHAEVKAAARYVTTLAGGHGAAREFCDLLLVASGRYGQLLESFS